MRKVLVTEPIHKAGLDILAQKSEIVMATGNDPETIIRDAANCQGILIRSAKITGEIIESLPELKVIAKHGIGVDNIDVQTATEKGIMVTNAPEANVNAVAEHALCLILSLFKNMLPLDQAVRKGEFARRTQVVNKELSGAIAGLLGFGRIGRRLAGKLQALGMKVYAFDPAVKPGIAADLGVDLVEMEELLSVSDIISVHVPLTSQTRGLIGKKELQAMKQGAYLVNVSRGGIVDETALYESLLSGHLAGAGLDVFECEPPEPDNPLFSLSNVTVSPHNAALTDKALYAMAVDAARGVVDCLTGKRPCYLVNPEVVRR